VNIAHVAYRKRSEGHPGGVPLFGHYLARCLGAREWSWGDYDADDKATYRDEPSAAEALGRWLVRAGKLEGVDAIVVDGFWGRGIVDVGAPIFSVAHGTWRGIGRACNSPNALWLGDVQASEYERSLTVAVSRHVERELRDLYEVRAIATIRNGVDTDEFRPAPPPSWERLVVMYPSDAWPKGGDIVAALRSRLPHFRFCTIGAGIGQEAAAIAAADIYLSPSRSDGNAYAGIQALACGLPVVASRTGLFAEIDDGFLDGYSVGRRVDAVDTRPETVARWEAALRTVADNRREWGRAARAWAEEYATLDRWAEEWRLLLETYAR